VSPTNCPLRTYDWPQAANSLNVPSSNLDRLSAIAGLGVLADYCFGWQKIRQLAQMRHYSFVRSANRKSNEPSIRYSTNSCAFRLPQSVVDCAVVRMRAGKPRRIGADGPRGV
jgi:hypothetical protein